MNHCAYCGSTILFGGARIGPRVFCNARCREAGAMLDVAASVPDDVIREHVEAVHAGPCPQCGRHAGPVDVHTSYWVWSALVLTSWSSRPRVSCRRCGNLEKLKAAGASLLVGWWGFPWGLVFTPVQVVRDLAGLCARSPDGPTPALERIVRLGFANQVASRSVPPPLPPRPT